MLGFLPSKHLHWSAIIGRCPYIKPHTPTHPPKFCNITSNNWKTGVNVVDLMKRSWTWSEKYWTANFCIHASKGPVIIMNQLQSIYNSPFKDSYSHPIHTCFPIIASSKSYVGAAFIENPGSKPKPAPKILWKSIEYQWSIRKLD